MFIEALTEKDDFKLLAINYTKFTINVRNKLSLAKWKQKSVKLVIPGIGATSPVTAHWLTPLHNSIPTFVLSLEISGVYYTIWGAKKVSKAQIMKVAESLTKS